MEAEGLRRPVLDISRYKKEISDYEVQVRRVSSQLEEVGGARTIDEMQKDQKALNVQAQNIRGQLSAVQSEKDRQRQNISILENKLRDSREKLTSIKHKLETSRSMKDQLLEYRENVKKQNRIIANSDKEIEALSPGLSKAQAKVNDITEAGVDKERRFQKEASRLFDSYNQLKTAYDEIEHYMNSGKAESLERCIQEVERTQKEVKRLQDEANNVVTQLNKLQSEKANAKNTEQKIINNLRYRQNKRNFERLQDEIKDLEAQNAEADRDRFQREAKRRQDKHMMLSASRSEIAGTMKSKDTELVQLVRDFEIDFKDAKDNFRKSTVKTQVSEDSIVSRFRGLILPIRPPRLQLMTSQNTAQH